MSKRANMYTLTLTLPHADFYEALTQEAVESQRFAVRVGKKKVIVTATDARALKSVVTSLLRLIECAEIIHDR